MAPKKAERFRGFNLLVEEVRPGVWRFAVGEIAASGGLEQARPPAPVRVPGEHPTKEAALAAARAHVDRVHANRKQRAG